MKRHVIKESTVLFLAASLHIMTLAKLFTSVATLENNDILKLIL